ncbi:MAG: vitamin K epoxide reductase family protein [Patescibacteria group bacterium]
MNNIIRTYHAYAEKAPTVSRAIVGSVIIIAFLGFLDAFYLTLMHFINRVPPCSILEGCETVTSSAYAAIGPIPVALLGAFYYAFFVISALVSFHKRTSAPLSVALFVTPIGMVFTLYLIVLQLFIIDAICIYCMGSALTSSLLFGVWLAVWSQHYRHLRTEA